MEDNNLLLNEGFLRDLSEATIIFSPLPGSSKKNIVIEDFENFNKYNVTTQELLYTWTEDWTIFFQILYC